MRTDHQTEQAIKLQLTNGMHAYAKMLYSQAVLLTFSSLIPELTVEAPAGAEVSAPFFAFLPLLDCAPLLGCAPELPCSSKSRPYLQVKGTVLRIGKGKHTQLVPLTQQQQSALQVYVGICETAASAESCRSCKGSNKPCTGCAR